MSVASLTSAVDTILSPALGIRVEDIRWLYIVQPENSGNWMLVDFVTRWKNWSKAGSSRESYVGRSHEAGQWYETTRLWDV